MSALSLYINTFRIVLKVNCEEESAWAHIYGSLSCLRQALSCRVCENLLMIPMRSSIRRCEHFVCKNCIGGEMKMTSCSQCTEYSKFIEDTQLRIVLQCFKQMCLYISTCTFFRNFDRSILSMPKTKFLTMINEGADYNDETHSRTFSSNLSDSQLFLMSKSFYKPRNRPYYCRVKMRHNEGRKLRDHKKIESNSSANQNLNANDNVPENINSDANDEVQEKQNKQINFVDSEDSSDSLNFANVVKTFKKRGRCRCGLATRNPGKLTCCGQRCPCYGAGRACFNCYCRGCRNPQKLTTPSTNSLLLDEEITPSSSNTKEVSGTSDSSDETSLSESSDEYLDESET